jgi:hypothetical protein
MVERVEVDVGEELAGLVADGDAAPALRRGKEVVAGEPVPHGLLGVAMVDDLVDQPQDLGGLDLARHQALEEYLVSASSSS